MSRFIRIKTPSGLLAAIEMNPLRFLIRLNYGAESSKRIAYDRRRRLFKVRNLIDGSRQVLTWTQLTSPKRSHIGPAMRAGAFYAELA